MVKVNKSKKVNTYNEAVATGMGVVKEAEEADELVAVVGVVGGGDDGRRSGGGVANGDGVVGSCAGVGGSKCNVDEVGGGVVGGVVDGDGGEAGGDGGSG